MKKKIERGAVILDPNQNFYTRVGYKQCIQKGERSKIKKIPESSIPFRTCTLYFVASKNSLENIKILHTCF